MTQLKDAIRNVEKKSTIRIIKPYSRNCSKDHHNNLEYVLTKEEGPDHDKSFYVNVKINDRISVRVLARTRKQNRKRRVAIDLLDGINN